MNTSAQGQRVRDADRSRSAILDAAETLFAERGFDAVTMAQIGAAAGLSRGTPGYFFVNKDTLYRAVVERAQATIRMLAQTSGVRDALGRRERGERLADSLRAFLTLLRSRRAIVPLIEAGADGAPHAEALRVLLSGVADDDPTVLAVLALCWFPYSQPAAARALGVDPDDPDFVERWHARVMRVALGSTDDTPAPADPVKSAAADTSPAPAVAPEKKKKKKKRKK